MGDHILSVQSLMELSEDLIDPGQVNYERSSTRSQSMFIGAVDSCGRKRDRHGFGLVLADGH